MDSHGRGDKFKSKGFTSTCDVFYKNEKTSHVDLTEFKIIFFFFVV